MLNPIYMHIKKMLNQSSWYYKSRFSGNISWLPSSCHSVLNLVHKRGFRNNNIISLEVLYSNRLYFMHSNFVLKYCATSNDDD